MVILALYSSRERWRPLMHPQERGAFVSTIIRNHIQNRGGYTKIPAPYRAVKGSGEARGPKASLSLPKHDTHFECL